jgi:hypothetical protein
MVLIIFNSSGQSHKIANQELYAQATNTVTNIPVNLVTNKGIYTRNPGDPVSSGTISALVSAFLPFPALLSVRWHKDAFARIIVFGLVAFSVTLVSSFLFPPLLVSSDGISSCASALTYM